MTRVIVILTVGRSGSSALAGALHQAGITFDADGDSMGRSADYNPKGHFEWASWWTAGKRLSERLRSDDQGAAVRLMVGAHKKVIAAISAAYPDIWGVKSPWFAWTLPHVIGLLPADHRVITIRRGRESSIRSMIRHGNMGQGMTYEEAAAEFDARTEAMERTADTLRCPTMDVRYEQLVRYPWRTLAGAIEFCYEDLAQVEIEQIERAVAWIDPELCHHA